MHTSAVSLQASLPVAITGPSQLKINDKHVQVCMHWAALLHIFMCMHVFMYAYTGTHIHVCMYTYTCMYVCIHVCIHAYMHVCIHTQVSTSIYTHTYTHTQTHIYIRTSPTQILYLDQDTLIWRQDTDATADDVTRSNTFTVLSKLKRP